MQTLYKRDSKGKVRQWKVSVVLRDHTFGIETTDGLVGGKLKEPVFKEAVANKLYKDPEIKAQAMMLAACQKKLRSNYFPSIDEISDEDILFMPTGCPSGMIWEEWKDKKHVVYPAWASPKLDGSKMYSTWRDGRVFLNTRSAKEHKNFLHIEQALRGFYAKHPNIVLDGEAYNHDYRDRFEELQSVFRKENPTDEERAISAGIAQFYIYDIVDLDRPHLSASDRQQLLAELYTDEGLYHISCLKHWRSHLQETEESYDRYHENCMSKGYEGSILKIANAPYKQSKNKNVMKRKPKFDCEFTITDVLEGSGTTAGMAGAIEINLTTACGMNEDHYDLLSKTSLQLAGIGAGWNHKLLTELLESRDTIIGSKVTVEYGGITAYGRLRFPKIKSVRTD